MVLKNIAFFRQRCGLSQHDLAAKLGANRHSIIRLEAGVGSTKLLVAVMAKLEIRIANVGDGATLGDQLRERRSRRGWTIADASARAGLAPKTIVALERGDGTVSSLLSLLTVLAPNAKLCEPLGGNRRRRQSIAIQRACPRPEAADFPTTVEIIHGDCIEIMATMPPGTIDLIIADPPYKLEMPDVSGVDDLLAHKGMRLVNEPWDKFSVAEYLEFTDRWLEVAMPLLTSTGSIAIFGTYHNIGLVNYALQRRGLLIINDIAWFKRNAVPHLAGRRLTASFETILWAAASKGYRFNYEAMKGCPDDLIHSRGNQMRNVWDIPTAGNESVAHPTQKPVAVYERLIAMTTGAGDTVLDPFAGSGTLGIAATKMGRHAVMIEKSSEYIDVVQRRMASSDIDENRKVHLNLVSAELPPAKIGSTTESR